GDWMEYYIDRRPHSALDDITPSDFYAGIRSLSLTAQRWFVDSTSWLLPHCPTNEVHFRQYGSEHVEEEHDFEPDWLKVAVEMVEPETNALLLLYDDAQSIYGSGRRKFSFKSVGVQAQGRTTILRLNYRNTAEVLKVAYEFAKDVLTPQEADEDGVPLIVPETANRHGPAPELRAQPNLAAEGDHIAHRFAALHAEGVPWRDMAVVYRYQFIGKEVAARLRVAGIPVEWLVTRTDGRSHNEL